MLHYCYIVLRLRKKKLYSCHNWKTYVLTLTSINQYKFCKNRVYKNKQSVLKENYLVWLWP